MKILTRTEFFNAIHNNCFGEKEYLVELLKLRGFILDINDNEIMLSDNGHKSDAKYLNELLNKYKLGHVKEQNVIINEVIDASLFEQEFKENISIGGEACIVTTDWRWFKHREHGEKVAVEVLEPFIARYVKAISACCVLTAGCCDGNHPGKNKMFLQLSGYGSVPWHMLICKYILRDKYNINWINDYTAIELKPETKYMMYYELNKAAEVIYDNRIQIRSVKNKVLGEMTNSYLKKTTPDEIEKKFIEKATAILSKNLEG